MKSLLKKAQENLIKAEEKLNKIKFSQDDDVLVEKPKKKTEWICQHG